MTTFSSGSAFGFKNLMAPQINPVLTYGLTQRTQLNAYIKLAPLFEFKLDNREIAAGVGLSTSTFKGRTFGLGLDYSALTLNLAGSEVKSTNTVLGGWFGF